MSKITVIDGCAEEHLAQLRLNLRDSDRIELYLGTGKHPMEHIRKENIQGSTFTYLYGDHVLCIGGVVPYVESGGERFGQVWCMATELGEAYAWRIVRTCSSTLDKYSQGYTYLFNFVYAGNTTAIEWLSWLGFEIKPEVQYGPFNKPFHPFIKKVSHV